MKTFKEFLIEIEEIKNFAKKNKTSTSLRDEDHVIQNGGKLISITPSGHKVYQTSNKGSIRKEYHAINPETKKVDVSVDGNERNSVMSQILLIANKGNTIKAHEFLHHLTTKHDKTMVWDKHSIGGKIAVQKLAKMKGVSSHGWYKGKPININASDDEYTHGPSQSSSSEEKEARDTLLVTHKTK